MPQPSTFTITVPDIHQGTAYLFYNVAVPANGARLLIDATGNPVGGSPVPMGATQGPLTMHLGPTLEKVIADQASSPVDIIMTAEEAYIETTLLETNLQKFFYALAHATYTSGTDAGLPSGVQAYEEITVGGIICIPRNAVAWVSPRRCTSPAKFMVGILYNAYAFDPLAIGMTRTKETIFKVRWEGISVTTRPVGDQTAAIYRQTGSP